MFKFGWVCGVDGGVSKDKHLSLQFTFSTLTSPKGIDMVWCLLVEKAFTHQETRYEQQTLNEVLKKIVLAALRDGGEGVHQRTRRR